jgi:hypothetical protein
VNFFSYVYTKLQACSASLYNALKRSDCLGSVVVQEILSVIVYSSSHDL